MSRLQLCFVWLLPCFIAYDADELVLHRFLCILAETDRQPIDRTSDASRYRPRAFILNAHHIVCLPFRPMLSS